MLLGFLSGLGLAGAAGWTVSSLTSATVEARYPASGVFLDLPEGSLHMVDSGAPSDDAPTILLLHGASSHHADLYAVLEPRLRLSSRVIAFDRPGHGWSDRLGGREMANPTRQAEVLCQALDALKIEKVTIVAHSLAGAVALGMAIARPDLVKGLVLLGAVSHPWPNRTITWYYHVASKPLLGHLFTRLLAIPFGTAVLARSIDGVFEPQASPPTYAETAQIRLVLRPATFVANAEDVAALHDAVEAQVPRYRELAMPVLAIAGTDDTVVWTDIHSRALVEQVQDGRLITLPGIGHMPHHVVPDLIAREALAIAQQGKLT